MARILSADLPGFGSLFIVTAVLAPILEETVFRGFLLPSLTKCAASLRLGLHSGSSAPWDAVAAGVRDGWAASAQQAHEGVVSSLLHQIIFLCQPCASC